MSPGHARRRKAQRNGGVRTTRKGAQKADNMISRTEGTSWRGAANLYAPTTSVKGAEVATIGHEEHYAAQSQQPSGADNTGKRAPGKKPKVAEYPHLVPADQPSSAVPGGIWGKRPAASVLTTPAPSQESASSQGPPVRASTRPGTGSQYWPAIGPAAVTPFGSDASNKGRAALGRGMPANANPGAVFGERARATSPIVATAGTAAAEGRSSRPASRASSTHSQGNRASSPHAQAGRVVSGGTNTGNSGTNNNGSKIYKRIPRINLVNPANEAGPSYR